MFGLTGEDEDGDESAATEQQHVHVSSRLMDRGRQDESGSPVTELTSLFPFSLLFLASVVTAFGGDAEKCICVSDLSDLRETSDHRTSAVRFWV